eukprot:8274722-Pyramimonas_sp.AAC.1
MARHTSLTKNQYERRHRSRTLTPERKNPGQSPLRELWCGYFLSQPQARAPAANKVRAGRERAQLPSADGSATSAARRRPGRREGGCGLQLPGTRTRSAHMHD